MASSGIPALDKLLVDGYPEKSAILVEGPPGNEKDALSYRFLHSGLEQGDFCVYVTRLPPPEIIQDAKAFGVDFTERGPFWISPESGNREYSPTDLASVSFGLKEILKDHEGGETRIVFDGLSQLLTLHPVDSVYKFLSQLLSEAKKYDSVILATVQEGMHHPQVVSTMELLFDGVLAVRLTGRGEPQVTIKKMRGVDLSAHSMVLNISHEAESTAMQGAKRRVAVLPFVNMSPNHQDEFFADGITEELISTISKINGLSVISRTSIMKYKNAAKSTTEIGEELRVEMLLEGSVRKSGEKLRITVQMINAKTDEHLWVESYDKNLEDVFAIQKEIAESVAGALKVNIDSEKAIGRKATSVPEAYVAYLNAVYFRNRGLNPVGFKKSVQYFEKAIELDPNFAEAYAQLAVCYVYFGSSGLGGSQAFSKAKELVAKALELNSTIAEAYFSRALISFFFDWNWTEYERDIKRAMEMNPSYVDPRGNYVLYLMGFGRIDEAINEAGKIIDLDPLDPRVHFIAGVVLALAHKFTEAILEFDKTLEIEPNDPWGHKELGLTYLRMGKIADGIRELEKAVELPGGELFKKALGYGYAISGKKEDAFKIATELEQGRTQGLVKPYDIALVYAGLGENSKALDLLEQAYDEHAILDFPSLNVEPAFSNLRSEPRFKTILKKMKLEAWY